jgi:DNA-binding MarR family transcriptional regulator
LHPGFLTFRLDLASALLTERANAVYGERWGLDVRALRVLRLACAEPGITPKSLSHGTLVEKTLLSKVLAELEARGLLVREPHPHDGRSVALRATRDGMKVARDSEKLGMALESELVAGLSAKERETLERLLAKLAKSLTDAAGRAGAQSEAP